VIGLVGGLFGLLLTLLGLWLIRQQPVAYADLARLDVPMFLLTFLASLVVSLLAGVLPAYRACRVAPAWQLKTL
jgi:putative ABC transport system permease protein